MRVGVGLGSVRGHLAISWVLVGGQLGTCVGLGLVMDRLIGRLSVGWWSVGSQLVVGSVSIKCWLWERPGWVWSRLRVG